jgi:aryl-alcohol dehydrogenase-like predicted oxidoreductase
MKVSELGFGGWGIGGAWWSGADDNESLKSLEQAKELGVNFFDSALNYGDGHSEHLIGKAIKSDRDQFIVTSKMYPKNNVFPPQYGTPVEEAYPPEWVVECTDRALKNYGLDYIDLQQFHVWINEWENDELLTTIDKLKREGKFRACGCSINFPYEQKDNGIPGIESGLFDTVQVVYNIYEQGPEQDVLKAAEKHNVGVIARSPLDEGALTGKITPDTEFPEGSFLDTYFKDDRKQVVYDKAQELNWLIEEGYVESLAEAAIRYVLSHQAVSSAIVGMRNPKHAKANAVAVDRGPLPQEALQRLKKHAWHHNYWI